MRFTALVFAGAFAVAADVNCKSRCQTVPSPNNGQVKQTTECVANCVQGNGSPSQSDAYTKCRNQCINDHYLN
ncbi:hypothetical protein HIM_10368 [Hirsutella minnesotensis 3608]|uniref:Extracellular membrane protein CFEM domain-containing protein n=1 Tax=Hirsutella minnesotensis 3608 TaxID=1043627 RepID=A0A0F8A2E1_9HYPO|nr:hypothetical protein HIM_10368 [Hirsutella minnesotensis 3608]